MSRFLKLPADHSLVRWSWSASLEAVLVLHEGVAPKATDRLLRTNGPCGRIAHSGTRLRQRRKTWTALELRTVLPSDLDWILKLVSMLITTFLMMTTPYQHVCAGMVT